MQKNIKKCQEWRKEKIQSGHSALLDRAAPAAKVAHVDGMIGKDTWNDPFSTTPKKNLWKHRWNFSRISAKNHQNFNVSPFFMYLPSVKSGHIFFKVFFRGKVQLISKLKPVSNERYESSTFYLWPIRILEICIFMWKNNNFENYVLLKSPDRTGWNFQWFAIL